MIEKDKGIWEEMWHRKLGQVRWHQLQFVVWKLVISAASGSKFVKKKGEMASEDLKEKKDLTSLSCFVFLFVPKGVTFWQGALSYVEHATGKASKASPASRVIKMLHTLADTFRKTYDYFKALLPWQPKKVSRWAKEKYVWEERASWLKWNQSQATSPSTILQLCLEA